MSMIHKFVGNALLDFGSEDATATSLSERESDDLLQQPARRPQVGMGQIGEAAPGGMAPLRSRWVPASILPATVSGLVYFLRVYCGGPCPGAGAAKRGSHPIGGPVGGRELWRSVMEAAGVEWPVARPCFERDRSPCRGVSGERSVRESRRGLKVTCEACGCCVASGCW